MINIEISSGHFSEIIKKGYSLDIIFLLKLIQETNEDFELGGAKGKGIIQTMERKNLITKEGKITEEGKDLLNFLSSTDKTSVIPRKRRKIDSSDFDKWWKEYPATDSFEYKGRHFKGSRALRTQKDKCREKIEKILKEGEYTVDDLIAALHLEISQKKEASYKNGVNKMMYMQNSLTYLNQYTYEAFIELSRQRKNVKQEFDGVNI